MVTANPALRPVAASNRMVLDVGLIRRASFGVALLLLLLSPFSPDPLIFAVGGFMPWLLLSIVGQPGMPIAAIFYFVWQWAQVFSRALVSVIDGEPMARGLAGPEVVDAYWYSMASLLALAFAFRLVLGGLPRPTPEEETAHLHWRTQDIFFLYLGTLVLAVICGYGARFIPGLGQQFEAVGRLKIVAQFLLFVTVLGTGKGQKFLLAAVVIEIVIGFSGLLSDFRGVFVYLAMAAIAARVAISATAVLGGVVWLAILLSLGLFWTAVKVEYREYASEGDDSQNLTIPWEDRMAYLGNLAMSPGNIDWGLAAYAMINRFAYIDIFGSVIAVQDATRQTQPMRQWTEALEHVFKPRLFFPDKAALSDSETYARLSGLDPAMVVRGTTSISVGYTGENYVDLGFPGMLGGIFILGLMLAVGLRYFLKAKFLPYMVKQGIALAFIYNVAGVGIEASLPKLFGSIVMFGVVYMLLAKFVLPVGLQWLQARASPEPVEAS